jgi:hypothetical protein
VVTNISSRRTVPAENNSLSHADRRFIAVPLGGVEVTEAHLDRGLDGVSGLCVVGKRSPESERRHLTAAVV